MMDFRFICAFLLVLLLNSCQENTESEPDSFNYPNVDQRLWTYFDRYEYEASLRGLNIDLFQRGISADIMEITDKGVAGLCSYGQNYPSHQIVIDADFWNHSNDLGREFVVFHELGHCHLYRGHLEDSFQNGLCVSIMRSGLGSCRDAYSTGTRAYYLDELFFNGP